MRWHTYINTQRSEAKLVNNFKATYGGPDRVIVCFGDYNQAHLKYTDPVKGKAYRELFRKAGYTVKLIDEHRTSVTCADCGNLQQKFLRRPSQRPANKGKIITVHGILECTHCRRGANNQTKKCNRDVNAAKNIYAAAVAILEGRDRPLHLRRAHRTH
jgi:hypothetical protein